MKNKENQKENAYVFVHGPKGKFYFSEIATGEDADSACKMIIDGIFKKRIRNIEDLFNRGGWHQP